MNCIKYSNDKEKFKDILTNEVKMSKMGVTLLNEVTNFDININEGMDGDESMCKAVEEWRKELLEEGMAKGKTEGIAQGIAEGIAQGKAEGIAQGKAEGKAEGQTDIVLRMKAKGLSDDEIENLTGLSIEFIKSVK